MNIHLSESRERFVRSLVQGGRYASEAEVIDEALRLLERRDSGPADPERRLEGLLLDGLDSGASAPMTRDDWDAIEREGQRPIAARRDREGR